MTTLSYSVSRRSPVRLPPRNCFGRPLVAPSLLLLVAPSLLLLVARRLAGHEDSF